MSLNSNNNISSNDEQKPTVLGIAQHAVVTTETDFGMRNYIYIYKKPHTKKTINWYFVWYSFEIGFREVNPVLPTKTFWRKNIDLSCGKSLFNDQK